MRLGMLIHVLKHHSVVCLRGFLNKNIKQVFVSCSRKNYRICFLSDNRIFFVIVLDIIFFSITVLCMIFDYGKVLFVQRVLYPDCWS